jgi:MFS family permease
MNNTNEVTDLDNNIDNVIRTQRLPFYTYILLVAQGINITVAVVSATIGAIVGTLLAPSPSLGTIAYGSQFAAVLLTTYPAASLMRRYGRKLGFMIGSISLCISGFIGYMAVVSSQFWLLILTHIFIGIFIGFANYYRFAAIDNTSDVVREKAMSLVVSGGIIAAVIGPLFSIGLRDIGGFPEFSIAYASISGLGFISVTLMYMWKTDVFYSKKENTDASSALTIKPEDDEVVNKPGIILAIFSAAGSYLIMNLLMIQAMLQMHDIGVLYHHSTLTVQAHVLAMFVPSLMTGKLISSYGTRRVIIFGYILLAIASLFVLLDASFLVLTTAMVVLGIGWNLTYVAGGIMLSKFVPPNMQYKFQGINDTIVAVCATIGATAPSFLQYSIGWTGSNIASLGFVLISIIYFVRYLPKDK